MSQAIQKTTDPFKKMIVSALPSIRQVAGKYIDPERLVKITLVARSRTPMLAKCAPESLLHAVMQSAECGLEPNTPLQHAALVPFKNKHTGQIECQFMPMYRGLIYMARRSAGLVSCRARIVHAQDTWVLDEGLHPKLEHVPAIGMPLEERGPVVFVYAVARMRDADPEWDYMEYEEIKGIQARAKSQSGPWTTDWGEMAKKTVIKRLMKQLPISDDVARAIELDDAAYDHERAVADVLAFEVPTTPVTEDRAEDLAKKVKGGKKKGKQDDPQGSLV